MSSAAYFIFSTPGVVVAFSIAALAIVMFPKSRQVRWTIGLVAVAFLAASTYAVPAAVSALLTRGYHRFERADVPAGRIALVVFGAGVESVFGWDRHLSIPNDTGAARVLEGWRVYQIARPSWVITSGGNPQADDPAEASGANMRDMLVQLGVPAERIIAESTSRETHENAQASAGIVRSLHADHVILVTSAVHMPRSIGAFHAADVDAVPAIAPDPWYGVRPSLRWTPTDHALYFSGQVVHELLGIEYYRLRGWSR